MATRSTIALEFADGTVGQVYCHFDGYLGNNGRILEQHYSDPFKLRDIMDRGSMIQLGNTVADCEFYSDEGDRTSWFENFQRYLYRAQMEEYNYILRQIDGKPVWFVSSYETDEQFVPLTYAFQRLAVETLK